MGLGGGEVEPATAPETVIPPIRSHPALQPTPSEVLVRDVYDRHGFSGEQRWVLLLWFFGKGLQNYTGRKCMCMHIFKHKQSKL